jgi:hypothetical protein
MHNVFVHLSNRFASPPTEPRRMAIAKTIDEVVAACDAAGIDVYHSDLREGLRTLVRLAPREEPADAGRHKTLIEMLDLLEKLSPALLKPAPRGTPAQHLRQCAAAWQAVVDAQNDQDPRQAAIAQRWSKEARLLEKAALEPRTLYIAKGPGESGQIIYGRIAATHDFEAHPVVVIHTETRMTYGPAGLPGAWTALVEHAEAIRSAVYDRQHEPGSVLSRLKGGMPSGVIAGAEALELDVLPDQPGHVGTAYGREPIAIEEILAAVGPDRAPKIDASKVVDALRETAERVTDMEGHAWSEGLTLAEWERQVLEHFRGQLKKDEPVEESVFQREKWVGR